MKKKYHISILICIILISSFTGCNKKVAEVETRKTCASQGGSLVPHPSDVLGAAAITTESTRGSYKRDSGTGTTIARSIPKSDHLHGIPTEAVVAIGQCRLGVRFSCPNKCTSGGFKRTAA